MKHHDMPHAQGEHMMPRASRPEVVAVAFLSFLILSVGVWLANRDGHLAMSTRNMRQQMSFDRRFIDMMAPHHQIAVRMAELALERSKRPEIREFAHAIIRDQNNEIGEMRRYRKAWYGSDRTPDPSDMPMIMEGMQMGADMPMDMRGDFEVFSRDPRDFDLAFLDAMIPHHASAIEGSQHAVNQAVHQEIVDLADGIIKAQEREIAQMRRWRQEWFPGR
jgi:uncharacterized protein (DUF305 family)